MAAATLRIDTRPVIGGQRVEPLTTETFQSVHPHDGRVVATYPACGMAEIDLAVAAARKAFEAGCWSGLAPAERTRVMHRLGDLLRQHGDELALMDSLEMGMPIAQALGDIDESIDGLRALAELASQLTDLVLPSAPHALALNLRVPHGVVGAITPWNFPLYVALSKVAPALAMGNSLVLKPSELASLSCLRLAELALEAGLPPGVFNVVPGRGLPAGQALARHMDVDCLTFTGSTATGLQLLQDAGRSNLKVTLLECGGKSPQLVFDDLDDMDTLADTLVQGFAWNSGQVCVAGTRILVAQHLFDRLAEALAERVGTCLTGDPLDPTTTHGPLASRGQFERVTHLLAQAHKQGARVLARGQVASAAQGCHLGATLLADVASDHIVMQDEVFGPVAGLMPFADVDQALALANATRYGLFATVWTRDLPLAHRFARRLRAGSVVVNAVASPRTAHVRGSGAEPVGLSGYGIEGGAAGLRAYTRQRSVQFNLG